MDFKFEYTHRDNRGQVSHYKEVIGMSKTRINPVVLLELGVLLGLMTFNIFIHVKIIYQLFVCVCKFAEV